jgi:hypothetical protein
VDRMVGAGEFEQFEKGRTRVILYPFIWSHTLHFPS